MASWQEALAPFAHHIESHFDRLKYRLVEKLGGPGPIKIVPYRGYGTAQRLYLKGRVLEDKGDTLTEENDRLWDNLVNTYRRIATDEIPFARVSANFQGQTWDVTADEEGFFEVRIDPPGPLPADHLWLPIELELLSPQSPHQPGPVRATGEVLVPPQQARFVVVSDIDDTVIQTDAAHLLRMARSVFLGNARTRLPFPGVSAFLRALFHGGGGDEQNPLFYVSSSPWNLYDLLSEFFLLNDIPVGPVLFLRDWGLTENELFPIKNREYKLKTIRQFLDGYSHLPFILIGDSGQEDPEIYTQLASEYPERILAVYVRNVSRDLQRPKAIQALAAKVTQAGGTLVLADNTLAMARHAVQQGWIAQDTLPGIHEEKKADEAPPTPIEQILGKEQKTEGPTVVVKKGQQRGDAQRPDIENALKKGDQEKERPPTVVVKSKGQPKNTGGGGERT